MTDKERLEEIKEEVESLRGDMSVYSIETETSADIILDDMEWLIEQSEQVQKLKEIKNNAINQIDVTQERNKRLEERVQELEEKHKEYVSFTESNNYNMDIEFEKLYKQNKRYREALEFYALGRHWITSLKDGRDYVNEYGELAEKTLKEESE